jgi:hypothetical protein
MSSRMGRIQVAALFDDPFQGKRLVQAGDTRPERDTTLPGFVNTVSCSTMPGLDLEAYWVPFERNFGNTLRLPPAGFLPELS